MFAVRFLVLVFLTCYAWSMGQIPPDGLNAFGKIAAGTFFIAAPALYLLPTYEAWKNKQANLTQIVCLNIFLGWTLIGWVGALVWALRQNLPVTDTIPRESVFASSYTPIKQPATKTCPFCAEDVLAAAIKCKHCGSELASAVS